MRAKGSADRMFKRTTNFKIVLSDNFAQRQEDLNLIKAKQHKRAQMNSKAKRVGA